MAVTRTLRNFTNAANEAAERYNERAASVRTALNLLRPDEVAGDYDAARLLQTTLGGQLRPITADDLRTFQATARALGKSFKGGITAKQVIDRSLRVDRDRANTQIRVALPRQYANGKMHFITNASAESKDVRHHVLIEFADFPAVVASLAKASEAAKFCATGKIKFACDCGRHTFWYSYLATIGKFNAGLPQINFPKIRNPRLVGVACKHVLRVMVQLSSPLARDRIAHMIEQARRGDATRVSAVTKKDAQELARLQAKQAGYKRSQVETSDERKQRLAQQRAVREVVEKAKAKAKKMPAPAKVEQAKRQTERSLRLLAQMGGISQKMLTDMLATLHGKK